MDASMVDSRAHRRIADYAVGLSRGRVQADEVGRQSRHAQTAVAGHDRFVDGRHAHRVGAQPREGADLRRGLEARPRNGQVDPLRQLDTELPGLAALRRRWPATGPRPPPISPT